MIGRLKMRARQFVLKQNVAVLIPPPSLLAAFLCRVAGSKHVRFALSQWTTVLYGVCLLILGEDMPHLARFQLDNGTYFEAELDESAYSGKVMRGGISAPDILAESNRTFQAAIGNVKAAAEAMVDGLRSLATPADAVSLEFGVKLTAETGAVIAKASADAHFVVKLEWKKADSAKD